jgi:cell division septation protein DedD
MAQVTLRTMFLMTAAAVALSGCVNGESPFARKSVDGDGTDVAAAPTAKSTRLVDRDVEAPEVFQTSDQSLWDGRPSLGGVWVASPDTKDPERVIIRNKGNGKFVIGALFRREIENPGPKLQISSDAAAALGILAGQPTEISVTALRREEGRVEPDATKPILDSSESVETATLDPVPAAAAALDRVESKPIATPAVTAAPAAAKATPAPKPAPAPQPAANAGGRTIQIGIFSVEANAKRAADTLKKAGLTGTIRREETAGKVLWSVTSSGDAAALTKVKGLGFPDAYFLKR